MEMKWFKRTIVGSQHHEYRNKDEKTYLYLFNIVKSPSGIINLYDLRDMPATYYLFTTVREAKKIAILSIKDKTVLEPYLDKEFYMLSSKTVKIMQETQTLIDKLNGKTK